MTSLVMTLTETLRYRGAIGQWSWVLHRLTGLGVVLFLFLHVIDTSWAVFYPALYVEAVAAYQSPLFTVGEFGLVAAVVYHALNGLRIAIFDYRPTLWKHQERAAWGVLIATVAILAPVFVLMMGHVIDHYSAADVFILPFAKVIGAQIPFAVGGAVALVVALLLSGLYGMIAGDSAQPVRGKQVGSRAERFWWSYMRVSGVLIIPLVFGHLAMMHVIQGVFDLTLAGHTVVGTGLINESGTAVEFVGDRWNYLVGGIAIWRVYDFGLLALAVIHGFNGLRYIVTDYAKNETVKRGLVYLCVILAVVLLVSGGGALFLSIDERAIQTASEALAELQALH